MLVNDFRQLTDLAFERLGGRVLLATDEFFAPTENLLKPGRGEFIADRYSDRGKWMDGWETRRRRVPGHDWCVIRLGASGIIRGVCIDTNHFRGNHPQAASVEAALPPDGLDVEAIARADELWTTILPEQPIDGHAQNFFGVEAEGCWSHVRLRIYPDGGVARFRVYGEPQATPADDPQCPDLASTRQGGAVIGCSDEFFGDPGKLLLPDPPANMGDGWETKRRRGPGHDWCVIRLGTRGVLEAIEVDTTHFKGNYPDRFSLEAIDAEAGMPIDALLASALPTVLIGETKLGPDQVHRITIGPRAACTHVRFNIFPDGGVARLRLFGRPGGPVSQTT
jgi:allantoicase